MQASRLFKQKNIPWLGVLVESVFNSLPLLSILLNIFESVSLVVVLYANTKDYLDKYLPGVTVGAFVGAVMVILLLSALLVMVLIYKYITPSLWTFRNNQMNKYDSTVIKKLELVEKKLTDLEARIKNGQG